MKYETLYSVYICQDPNLKRGQTDTSAALVMKPTRNHCRLYEMHKCYKEKKNIRVTKDSNHFRLYCRILLHLLKLHLCEYSLLNKQLWTVGKGWLIFSLEIWQ
jgi:hypothetical protein